MIEPHLLGQSWRSMPSRGARAIVTFALLICLPAVASAQTFPPKPPASDFYVDLAGLIQTTEAQQINSIAGALLSEERIPIYVVTIRSLADFGASAMGIEAYALALFNEWGIGFQDRNNGMLLLVSLGDRKARIEFGADWAHRHDAAAKSVMDTLIVPKFKSDDYSVGILDGVRGMEAMARGLNLPKPKTPWWFLPLVILGAIAIVALIVNLFRTGRKGWAWVVIAAVGVMLFVFLRTAATRGGSGGGFGGGSGGGGGASGSW
ncbi:MAG: TPM domain-containing protein [Actinobacteria bacterium]|nr:TPM domain-containing protein [Actinomycetota bacterium]